MIGLGRGRRGSIAIAAIVAVALLAALAGWALTRDDDRAELPDPALLGEPVTEANGIMGPLYQQNDNTYVGLLDRNCTPDERLVELSIHAGPEDTANGVATPWEAVTGTGVGVFMSYMPCDTGIREARYILGATGRWFVFTAVMPAEQYERMSKQMTANETSPAPDWTVTEDELATLTDPEVYSGWAIIDRPA